MPSFRLDPANEKDREFLEKIGKRVGKDIVGDFVRARNRSSSLSSRILKAENRDNKRPQEINYERTDKIMQFTLPYPPSTNNLYYTGKDGKRHLTGEGKEYKKTVATLAHQQKAFLMSGTIAFELHIFRPRRIGDTSNRLKIVEDALKQVAWYDDEQVAEFHVYRHLSRKNPRIEMKIWQVK